jgi:hypothetical protein
MKRYFTYLLSALLLSFALSLGLTAQVNLHDIKGDLPKMLGANNAGKEFWFAVPPCYEDESGGHDNFVKVFVTSPVKTLVKLEVPGRSYQQTKMTIANDVIEFNIPAQIAQPFSKGGHDPAPPDQVYKGYGFHITADQPLVVYVVIRYWYTSDGFLALPISSLGKEYICASYPDMSAMYGGYYFPSEVTITGAYPDTKVYFTVGGNVMTKTASGYKPGQTVNQLLQPGDVWAISSSGAEADLTGSKVLSNRPVSVISGNQCTNIPTNNRWCDYTVEADLPTFTWGTDYHVGKVPGRKFASLIRIFAKEPNTKVFRDGNQIGVIPEGGGPVGRGFLEMRMVGMDEKPRSVVISGDKPIGVTLYNCGVEEDGYPYVNSDPFVMSITPVQQYQKEITFCTPGVNGSGFPENYINVVYETNEFGMIPEDLEFAEVNSGQYVWYKMRSKFAGTDEMFRKDVSNKKYAVKTIKLQKDGVYKIRAKSPFAAYSFGYSNFDSYGFPTSAALADLEKPDTLCPVPKYTMSCLGEIKDGTVEDMPKDPAIRSNLAMIVFHDDTNFVFTYKDFEPGAVSTTAWTLNVVDATQDAVCQITFTDRRGNDTTITIRYNAIKLDIEPKFADWGTLKTGDVIEKDFEAINKSTQSAVKLTQLKLKSGAQGFEIVNGPSLPIEVPPMGRVPFKVRFTATVEGSFKDSVGLGDTCYFWNKTLVKAMVGEPIITVTDVDFGDQRVGVTTQDREMTVNNIGSVDLTITEARGNYLTVFKSDLQTISQTSPLIIPPGKEHRILIKFTPDAVKNYLDSITFSSDARTRDSIGTIKGAGLLPDLLANGYDWGRRRITRAKFPIQPYPADNGFQVIKLVNYGTFPVKISGLDSSKSVNSYAFLFDRDQFNNMRLDTGEVNARYIEVKFLPDVVGNCELEFTYINDAGSTTKTRLFGIGILPRIKTTNYDFGITMVNDKNGPNTKLIMFTNDIDNYDYGDDLLLTDLVATPNANDINTDLTKYGAEGFQYDKAALKLPITIKKGQSITFDAKFMAPTAAAHSAKLTSVSDAEADQTSNWNGAGLEPKIDFKTTEVNICTGTEATIDVTISNPGTGDLEIFAIDFDQVAGNLFTFVDPNDAKGFTLTGGSSKVIKLKYTPNQFKGLYKNALLVKNSTQSTPTLKIDIQSTSVHYNKTASAVLQTGTDNKPLTAVNIGQDFKVSVNISGSDNIAKADIKELNVILTYNSGYLKTSPANVAIGGLVNGKFTFKSPVTVDEKNGKISMNLVANPGQSFNGEGELINVTFRANLPSNNIDTSLYQPTVSIVDNGKGCVDVANVSVVNKLNPICVYDIRKIMTFGTEYMLSNINPNPVTGSSTSLKFGVGLEANTDITIVNSNGQLIANPVNGVYKPGEYEINLNVTNMPSGVYYIKMKSGPFNATRELVITK